MSTIATRRKARVPHRCTFCRQTIRPGELYFALALTPNDPEISNTTWWHLDSHGRTADDCAAYWAVDPYASVHWELEETDG